jgi:hypothetical protein
MSLKSRSLAGFAAAALIIPAFAGISAVTGTANAATPSCGGNCLDLFSHQFGTFADPQFVMDSYKQGEMTGTPVILFRTSNSDPAEDFTVDQEGLVSQFYALGMVSPELDLHYGCTYTVLATPLPCTGLDGAGYDFEAYEFAYTPYGVDTGLCTGVAATAVAGEHVTLQPCGVSSKTLWVAGDVRDYDGHGVPAGLTAFEQPLINGSDTNFSVPFALTYGGNSYPTDVPRPPLYTANITGFTDDVIGTNQLWSADTGVLP